MADLSIPQARRSRIGFTLVELLVVIGIIALLISILLPVLGSARKAAQAVKCGAALREIGNSFAMYAMENHGYYPPMRTTGSVYRITFNSTPPTDLNLTQQYWMFFLAKYVSKGKFGSAATTGQDASYAMRSVLWGCPNFVPILSTSATLAVAGQSVIYTGYGMNGFPEYTANYPLPNAEPPYNTLGDTLSATLDTHAVFTVNSASGDWKNYAAGAPAGCTKRWYKQTDYTRPAERALVGDCRAYVLEAMQAMTSAEISGQADLSGAVFWAGGPTKGQTSMDFYRHGQYPARGTITANTFAVSGGRIGYNVLFADGHVSKLNTREEGFKAARMRFPG